MRRKRLHTYKHVRMLLITHRYNTIIYNILIQVKIENKTVFQWVYSFRAIIHYNLLVQCSNPAMYEPTSNMTKRII